MLLDLFVHLLQPPMATLTSQDLLVVSLGPRLGTHSKPTRPHKGLDVNDLQQTTSKHVPGSRFSCFMIWCIMILSWCIMMPSSYPIFHHPPHRLLHHRTRLLSRWTWQHAGLLAALSISRHNRFRHTTFRKNSCHMREQWPRLGPSTLRIEEWRPVWH